MALIGSAKYGATGPITSKLTIYIGRGAASILVRSTPRVSGVTWSIGEGQPMAVAGRDWRWWFDLTDVGFVGSGATSNVTVVTAPLWIPTLAFAVAAARPWRIVVRMRRRFGPHQCKRCGYDRRGLAPDAKCPECGKV